MATIEASRSHRLPTPEVIRTMLRVEPDSRSEDPVENLLAHGAGMFADPDVWRNREASGILNHVLLVRRGAVYIAEQINKANGSAVVDTSVLRRGFFPSHLGAIPWYTNDSEVRNQLRERYKSQEAVGIKLLKRFDIDEEIQTFVKALAHGVTEHPEETEKMRQSLEFKIAIYADHCIDQGITSLQERMSHFLSEHFLVNKDPDTVALNKRIVTDVILKAKDDPAYSGNQAIKELANSSMYKAQARGNTLEGLFQLIINDARTEKELEAKGFDPNTFTEAEVKPDWFEKYIRRLHLQPVEREAAVIMRNSRDGMHSGLVFRDNTYQQLGDTPNRAWWDNAIIHENKSASTHRKRQRSYILRKTLPRHAEGAQRADRFLHYIHMTDKEKKEYRSKIAGPIKRQSKKKV